MHFLKSCKRSHRSRPTRQGAMLVLIAFTLPLMVMMAAFALDVAWMQLVRSELRTATDAASRAGAKTLSLGQNVPRARAAAKDAANRNTVAGNGLTLDDSEIVFGRGQQANNNARFAFRPGGNLLNAVRVTGNRTAGSADGPVRLFLGNILGVNNFEPTMVATTNQLDRDICLVVDRSGSMMQEIVGRVVPGPRCGPPHPTRSRWGALATAVKGFINELQRTSQHEQCGLVSYSSAGSGCGGKFTTSDINAQLDRNYGQILSEMVRMSSGPVQGRTCISAGIDNGIQVLTSPLVRPFAIKSIVLLTDGRHNTGKEPIISARDAAALDIRIDTITFSDEADFARMRAVASATGGQHFHAPDAAALERIFRQIASTLPVITTE